MESSEKARAAASRGPVGGAQQDDDDDGGADESSASSRSEDDLSSAARELQEQKEEQAALLDDREDLQEQVNARDARVDQLTAQVEALLALVARQNKAARPLRLLLQPSARWSPLSSDSPTPARLLTAKQ